MGRSKQARERRKLKKQIYSQEKKYITVNKLKEANRVKQNENEKILEANRKMRAEIAIEKKKAELEKQKAELEKSKVDAEKKRVEDEKNKAEEETKRADEEKKKVEEEKKKVEEEKIKAEEEKKKVEEEKNKAKEEKVKAEEEKKKVEEEMRRLEAENVKIKAENNKMGIILEKSKRELKELQTTTNKNILSSVTQNLSLQRKTTLDTIQNRLSGEVVHMTDNVIGEGTFGVVRVGIMVNLNSLKVAIKYGKSPDHFNVNHEASCLQRLQSSKYFPHLFGVLHEKIVMEYITFQDTTPLTIYRARVENLVDQNIWKHVCCDLIKALIHIHKNGLLHNDLKSNNVLLRHNFSPVIVDFGKATLRKYPTRYRLSKTQQAKYNRKHPYLAFELRNVFDAKTSMLSDVFSLGYIYNFVADKDNGLLQELQLLMQKDDVTQRISSKEVLKRFEYWENTQFQ